MAGLVPIGANFGLDAAMRCSLSPLAGRDGVRGACPQGQTSHSEPMATPPHPDPLPASGEREQGGPLKLARMRVAPTDNAGDLVERFRETGQFGRVGKAKRAHHNRAVGTARKERAFAHPTAGAYDSNFEIAPLVPVCRNVGGVTACTAELWSGTISNSGRQRDRLAAVQRIQWRSAAGADC
jgi:hypothetical protein